MVRLVFTNYLRSGTHILPTKDFVHSTNLSQARLVSSSIQINDTKNRMSLLVAVISGTLTKLISLYWGNKNCDKFVVTLPIRIIVNV